VSTRILSVSLAVFYIGIPLSSQVTDVPDVRRKWTSCWNEDWKDFKTRQTLKKQASPDGKLVAVAIVIATATAGASSEHCESESELQIQTREGHTVQSFLQRPGPEGNGNNVELIAWSADSRYLLAEMNRWVWASEGWSHDVLIYDLKLNQIRRIDLEEVFARSLKKDCELHGQLIGFAGGRVLIEAWPLSNDAYEETPCAERRSLWELDLHSGTVIPRLAKSKP
jgi:hypothetical protein